MVRWACVLLLAVGGDLAAQEWGSVSGRVLWGKDSIPAPKLTLPPDNQDRKHCEAKGELPDEKIVVDPATKGVRHVFVYVKSVDKIHPSLPQDKEAVAKADEEAFKAANKVSFDEAAKAVTDGKLKAADLKAAATIDQPLCVYTPRAVALREGQRLLVKNPDKIAHNVKIDGFADGNAHNVSLPPNSVEVLKLNADTVAIPVSCSIHPWMQMNAMVFEHPYFTVTAADGSFKLKDLPAGELELVIRNSTGEMIVKKLAVTVEGGKDVAIPDVKWTTAK